MSEVFTIHDNIKCEICNDNMIELQAGRFKCLSCGSKDDGY